MKNLSKVLALVLVIAMVFSMAISAGAATSFKDDATINYDEAVQLLSALDVINGYDTDGDGVGDTFKPGDNITRAELAVMVSYMVANEWSEFGLYSDIAKLNADYKALCTFADSKAHWAAGFIAYCAGNGYLSGRNADTFDPEADVTVAEASVILLRVMGYDAVKEDYGTTAQTVKGYNLQLDARNAGLLNGMDNVDFFAAATREQVAQLIMNALDGYVVTYNTLYDFSLIFNPQLIIAGNTAYQTNDKLVNFCFQNVEKVAATNAYGYAGHQWIAHYKTPTTVTVALTEVFVDDTVMTNFKGGTPMATVAAAMGLNAKSSPIYVKFFENGKEVAGAGYYNYNQLSAGFVADNATLVIVRDYDRSVGGTYYKLMYYYEYIATVTRSAGTITDRTSAHYGEYYFNFTYYNTTTGDKTNNYVFSANKDAYDVNALYLVVPNDGVTPSYPNYSTITDKEFFLSIKAAQVSEAVKVTGAQTNVPAASSYVFVGTAKYNMSKVYEDFTKAGFAFNTAVHFVFNSAGYVIATVDPAASYVALETGYVYLDKFEYAVTVTGTSSLINQSTYTWSAQAKAQVYFPSVTGTTVPTVIDIATAKTTDAYGAVAGGVAYIANVNAMMNANSYAVNADGFVALSNVSTSSYWDLTNDNYVYGNTAVNGNVRVYDKSFDGWYKYEKQTNGTYVLIPVEQDGMTTYGNLKVETSVVDNGTTKSALYLTSATTLNTYKMDLATMTATVASVTGYASIPAGAYGSNAAAMTAGYPAMGVVGGEIAINARYADRIDSFSQFSTVNPTGTYNNAFYVGRGDYNTYLAKWEHFFYINGQKVVLFAASEVAVTDKFDDPTAATVNVSAADLALIETAIYDLVLDAAGNLKVVTRETVVSSGIKAFTYVDGANYLHFAPTAASQVVGGLTADANGLIKVEFNTAKVYDMDTGAVTTIAAGDTVYYVLDNGKVAEIWVDKLVSGIPDPMKPF